MKIKNLSITFHTDKTKECVEFYKRHFGATVTFDDGEWYVVIRLQTDPDTLPIYLSFQGDNDLYQREHFTGGLSLNIKVEDVDACYQKIRTAELPLTEDITNHKWGDRAFNLKDPLGNILYIFSDRELHEKYKYAVKE